MKMFRHSRIGGFTLVEVLMSIGIGGFSSAALFSRPVTKQGCFAAGGLGGLERQVARARRDMRSGEAAHHKVQHTHRAPVSVL